MSRAWWWLLSAAFVEALWSQSIKPTDGFTRLVPTMACFALGASSVYLLTHAMATLPVGTAYVVFTGLGGLGAVALGVAVHRDPISLPRLMGLALIIAGVAVTRAAESG